ncbi:ly6/PLAUR domain-containing protein 1 isoform X1 [Camelus dromedarius]|uniref:ly6/PLAUR domain-containing protein 1 isoform X1 n=1 Tax=Camelus dromedarius TaxID=9838 RepID=UPI0031192B62
MNRRLPRVNAPSWARSPPHPAHSTAAETNPGNDLTTERLLERRESAAARDTLESLQVCKFTRRTRARSPLVSRQLPAPAAQQPPRGWAGPSCRGTDRPPGAKRTEGVRPCEQRAFGAAAFRPHLPGPAAPAAPSSRFPWSPASENYPLFPCQASHRRRLAEAAEEGYLKGVGTWKDGPSLPRSPPPPQLGSRHVVPGVGGGEKRRDFFGCSGSPVVPSVSAANSEDALLLSREREPEERRPAAGSTGAGDAGAGGGTCGSSWRRQSPRRQQRGPQHPPQPQPLRPGQPRPRSLLLMRLPAPGPAAPGGCGSSASQQLFADCSCFKALRCKSSVTSVKNSS